MKSRLLAVAVLAFGVSACEFSNPLEELQLKLDVQDVPVEVPQDGNASLQVAPGAPAVSSTTVSPDLDVASIEEFQAIQIKPEFLQFARVPGKTGAVAASGTVTLMAVVDGVPLTPVVVTITNDQVTGVQPDSISINGAVTMSSRVAIQGILERLTEDGVALPELVENWETQSEAEAVEHLLAAINKDAFSLALVAVVEGDELSGSLTLTQLEVDARVVRDAE